MNLEPKQVQVRVRLDDTTLSAIEAACRVDQRSREAWIRVAIEEKLEKSIPGWRRP